MMDRSGMAASLGKNLTSPRKRFSVVQSLKRSSSAISVSGRSNQSVQVIFKTAWHVVESFGPSLPVLVTEVLTFLDPNVTVSAKISTDGWACLVCGRRALIWQCKTTVLDPKQRRTFDSRCRELLLPQSDLAHRADCVAVWLSPGQQVPSCMAVSPEGTARYWASIAHEESSVETGTDLAGQEVYCLDYVPGHGCILATTSCSVALLQPRFINGRNTVSCRVLRTSQGWLGGIGRRMSSLIFGTMPQTPVLETKLVRVTCASSDEKMSRVLILAGSSLQYWSFPRGESEKLEFDEDVGHTFSQMFQRRFWESSACTTHGTDTWLMDVQMCEEGIVVLAAASCAEVSPQVHFAIGLLPLSDTTLTNSLKWFIPLKVGPVYLFTRTECPEQLPGYRLILSGWEAIVYSKDTLLVVNVTSEHEQENVDLVRRSEDKVLGGSLCSGTPVFFTRNLGLVAVMPADFASQEMNASYSEPNSSADGDANNSMFRTENLTRFTTNEHLTEMSFSSNGVAQFSAAFLLSLRRNKSQCSEILAQLFPQQGEPMMDVDATLDTTTLAVGKNLIDDYPVNDPRWASHRDSSTSSMLTVTTMQIPHQLEGKQTALDLFISFLKEFHLWERFCAVSYRGIIMATSHVIGEYAEKVIAARTIYNLHNRHSDIIDDVIRQTLTEEEQTSPELTARDMFYREVSKIHKFLPALVNSACDITQSDMVTPQVARYIHQVNSILLGVLREVVEYRQRNAEKFVPARYSNGTTEYLPWTAATRNQGIRNCLQTMQNLTLKYGIGGTNDGSIKKELYEQLVGLIDLTLDGKKCHLESIRGTDKFQTLYKQYENERAALIQPLVKKEQYEHAATLAEKYGDFASLVQICELTDNQNRLDSYVTKFASQDFAGFLFSWYVKNGRQGKLVEKCRRGGAVQLMEKLSEHPSLSWLQAALGNEARLASNTLHTLANEEIELVTRKKSMLSLAKLALLVSEEEETPEELEECLKGINSDLELIAHQEELPANVLASYGYDIDKLRVLTPSELIMLYTCDENVLASEYDFKKALDLLDFVDQEDDRASLRIKIWARAAKRDRWDSVGNNPEQQAQDTLFFKLVDLAHFMGAEIRDILPPLETILTESELDDLASSSKFQFLLKIGYEYVYHNYETN